MRIVAGRFKGVRLETPESNITRPTSDRARENLFNILSHGAYGERLRGASVLEIFAGTGALGLEAVSRGAASCDFVEFDRRAIAMLRANINKCKAKDVTSVIQADAYTYRIAKPYDLILLDPPYGPDAVERALDCLASTPRMVADSLVIAQSDPKIDISIPDGWANLEDRKYGAARFLFLERPDG